MAHINTKKFKFREDFFTSIEDSYVPKTVFIPLGEDFNEEIPLVKTNSLVKEGQLLFRSLKTGAYIHSSIPGTLTEYKVVSLPNGKKSKAAVIRMDGEFSVLGKLLKKNSWSAYTDTQITSIIEEAGIRNTYKKDIYLGNQLSSFKPAYDSNNVLVARLYDADPSCETDRFIAKTYTKEVFEGLRIIAKVIHADAIIILHSKLLSFPEEIQSFNESNFSVSFIPVDAMKYPQGNTREINKKLKQYSKHSSNCFYIDSSTAYSVYNAVLYNTANINSIVQVSGDALRKEKMFFVKHGTPIRKLVEECGGFVFPPSKIIINGMIKGISIADPDTPITNYIKSITILASKSVPNQEQTNCIRCGDCHRACSANIHPDSLFMSYQYNIEFSKEITDMASLCNKCGLCNIVCPSRLPLFQTISLLKGDKNE